jgi:3-phenylpropionate/trans-cinnamate dioxygenase ferredoxin subunit
MSKIPVAQTGDIPPGTMKAVRAGSEKMVVYHLDDGFYATQHLCTHTLGPLARGKIVEGGQVQCPLHRARFDIRTGDVVEWANFPPGVQLINLVRREKALTTYPVSVEDETVYVDL